jgi:hypothetical protein
MMNESFADFGSAAVFFHFGPTAVFFPSPSYFLFFSTLSPRFGGNFAADRLSEQKYLSWPRRRFFC